MPALSVQTLLDSASERSTADAGQCAVASVLPRAGTELNDSALHSGAKSAFSGSVVASGAERGVVMGPCKMPAYPSTDGGSGCVGDACRAILPNMKEALI